MSGLSQYLEKKVLDHLFGKTTYTAPATCYVGLFTALPSDSGGGTEVSGGSYARLAITNNTTNFPNASGGSPSQKTNGTTATWAAGPSADWGLIVGFGIFDAPSSGNLLAWAPLQAATQINNGDAAPSFAIGELAITLD